MPPEDITQICLGKFRMGIIGLKEAIEEVKPLQGRPDEEIAQALFDRLRVRNYIPDPSREDHKQAFLKEFKKACGEKVAENRQGLVIQILGTGCPACESLEQMVMAVLAELNLPAEVEHVRDRQEIMALGVFGTPALIINDEVKAAGQTPHKDMLKKWLAEAASSHQRRGGERL